MLSLHHSADNEIKSTSLPDYSDIDIIYPNKRNTKLSNIEENSKFKRENSVYYVLGCFR